MPLKRLRYTQELRQRAVCRETEMRKNTDALLKCVHGVLSRNRRPASLWLQAFLFAGLTLVWVVTGVCDTTRGEQPKEVEIPELPQSSRPHLLSSEEIALAKRKAREHAWAETLLDGIVSQADSLVASEIEVPDKGGQWTHYYSCPDHGARLETVSPTEHSCPIDGRVFTGWPYDDVVISFRHRANLAAMATLGMAYAFTGEEKYAGRVRALLLAYADRYEGYELHNTRGEISRSAGRMFAQTLDESVMIIKAATGYDLVRGATCFSASDRETIEERFFRPLIETIRRNRAGKSNWQSWHNAAIAVVGVALRDTSLLDDAVNGDQGFLYQMDESVLEDGMWYEGAIAYHFYALSAHTHLLEAARHVGVDLYRLDTVRKMFDGPLAQLYPDMTYPAINDSDRGSIYGARGSYELAFARYRDARYAAPISKRDTTNALLYGAESVPKVSLPRLPSANLDATGLAALRSWAEPPITVMLDYGPHGGGHGHPDKLNLMLFALGEELMPDPGRLAYSVPAHQTWYKQTVSHNTIVVDEKSQAACEGTLLAFETGDEVHIVRASTADAYPGVVIDRTVALTDDYVLDLVVVNSEEEHTYDLPYHVRGRFEPDFDLEPAQRWPESVPGYSHFANVRKGRPATPFRAQWVGDNGTLKITFCADRDIEVICADGLGNPPQEVVPTVMLRASGRHVVFAALIEPLAAGRRSARRFRLEPLETRISLHVEDERGISTLSVLPVAVIGAVPGAPLVRFDRR